MGEWQPIDTAPLNDQILIFDQHYWRQYAVTSKYADWWVDGENGDNLKPTHWMSLPEPPK